MARTKDGVSTIKIKLTKGMQWDTSYHEFRLLVRNGLWRQPTAIRSDGKDRIEAKRDGKWNWRNKPSPFTAGEGKGSGHDDVGFIVWSECTKAHCYRTRSAKLSAFKILGSPEHERRRVARYWYGSKCSVFLVAIVVCMYVQDEVGE